MKNIVVTGATGSLSKTVAEWLKSKDGLSVTQMSVRGNDWEKVGFSGVDCIVHIAGVTPQNAKSSDDYFNVNALLTKKLADRALSDGVKQFIYISSMAVYGVREQIADISICAVKEDTVCNPISDYGKSKLEAEKLLNELDNTALNISIIRTPSIYGKGKGEYLKQYKYLGQKLPIIPDAFRTQYKSAICTENLCELIYLVIDRNHSGIICPSDGAYTAVDFCSAIFPNKKKSRFLGKLIEIFMSKNSRIIGYYGAVCYSNELTDVFNGEYRVVKFNDAIREACEK